MKKIIWNVAQGLKVLVSLLPAAGGFAATSAHASEAERDAWSRAQATASVASYSSFILSFPASVHADEAFCLLYAISEGDAETTRSALLVDYPNGTVDLAPCATGDSARLMNI